MESNQPTLPDLAMPPGRARERQLAIIREIHLLSAAPTRSARRKATVLATSAGVLLTGVMLTSLTANSPSLTSSWTAMPTPVADAAAAGAACRAQLLGQHWPLRASAMTVALAEQRGKLTTVLMTNEGQYGMCITGPQGMMFVGIGSAGPFDPASGIVLDGDPGQLNGAGAFRLAYGQVGSSVARVYIDLDDGSRIDATVTNGRFLAWWPSGDDPISITATTGDGHVVKVIHPSATSVTPVHSPAAK